MPRSLEFTQVSSAAFKSWKNCRRQFYYKHVKGLQWPTDIQHFRLGRDVHKLLDYQARGLDCAVLAEGMSDDVRRSWEKLSEHPIVHLPVLANEWAFHVPVHLPNGRTEWLTGRLDRVSREGDRLLLIDWKTGTGIPRQPDADWQTMLYLYALVEVAPSPSAADLNLAVDGPLRPEQVEFVYVEVKADENTSVREVRIPYDSQKHRAVGELITTTLINLAAEEEFPLPSECPDRFCAYGTICGIAENS
jgi:hypothetical protein